MSIALKHLIFGFKTLTQNFFYWKILKRIDSTAFWSWKVFSGCVFFSIGIPILKKTQPEKKLLNFSTSKCSRIDAFQNFSIKKNLRIAFWVKKLSLKGFCVILNRIVFLTIFVNLWKRLECGVLGTQFKFSVKPIIFAPRTADHYGLRPGRRCVFVKKCCSHSLATQHDKSKKFCHKSEYENAREYLSSVTNFDPK